MKIQSTLSSILLICCLCITLSTARAQYVAIPDTIFGNWLMAHGYSSCLSGNGTSGFRLDTTCSTVVNATGMYMSAINVANFTGLAYFKHLDTLQIDGNDSLALIPAFPPKLRSIIIYGGNDRISSLPALPDSLTELAFENTQLTSLPALPSTLILLEAEYNQITALPVLPAVLCTLDVSHNYISSLPATLPPVLQVLEVANNNITSLPVLPSTLTTLIVSYNTLNVLPTLPAGLTGLTCDSINISSIALPPHLQGLSCMYNHITTLPALPSSIYTLLLDHNPLTALPALPSTMYEISCQYCDLDSLPALPTSLYLLDFAHNHLTSVPTLPLNLSNLFVDHNNITALPALPSSISYLVFDNNPISCFPYFTPIYSYLEVYTDSTNITCMPNRFQYSYSQVNLLGLPLCNSTSGCPFYYNIAGNVHQDTSATCLNDSLYNGPGINGIKLLLSAGGQVVRQTYSAGYGYGLYTFKTDSVATYTVSIDTSNVPFHIVCPQAGDRIAAMTASDTVFLDQDFGIGCRGVDNGVNSIYAGFIPAQTSIVSIDAGDMALNYNMHCANHSSGTVTITMTGPVQYLHANGLTPSAVSGNTVTFIIPDFNNVQTGDFDLTVLTDTTATIGAAVCITAMVYTNGGVDIVPANDLLTECFVVNAAFDPNEKTVSPLADVRAGDWLYYTVAFQNTGTDTAHTVVVRDTLDSHVDPLSFQFLASDHQALIDISGFAVTFTFAKIDLPDSSQNGPLSRGWLQYKVRAKTALASGTTISNKAAIYFDVNPAVETNTTNTQIVSCTNTASYASASICGGSYTFDGMTLTTSGLYADTLQVAGCDSISFFYLNAGGYSYTASQSICQGDTFVFGTHHLSTQGSYSDTLTAAGGCDSILTLTLTVLPLPQVTLSWQQLLQQFDLQLYALDTVWCQSGPINNPTVFAMSGGNPIGGTYHGVYIVNDSFNYYQSGGYYTPIDTVTYTYVDSNGCSASAEDVIPVSPCEGIQTTPGSALIYLYPNPNHGSFTLETSNNIGSDYAISDMLGNIIAHDVIKANEQSVDLKDASEGVYTLVVKGASPVRFVVVR